MSLTAGNRLGPYEIISTLGSGGMGVVYLARDTRLSREVAIKVLPPHLAETPDARARFEREARAVSSLNHPNICALYDVGRENGVSFLVLERIDGETLATRLSRGALPLDQALRLGMQIADALDRAHRGGIVHRDLKPGNVMLAKGGAKLMDFGLAQVANGLGATPGSSVALTQSPSEAQPVTAEGSLVGTFQYMAPEQLEGKPADARSDLWALGCVLYEMITGKRAFEGGSQASLISAIMSSEPPRMNAHAPLTPPSLDRLVRACLAKDPSERIQSAHDVKLQLAWIAEGEMGAEASARRRSPWRARAAWAAASIALAGLAIVATLALRPPRRDEGAVRFRMLRPPGMAGMSAPEVSSDGRSIAFVAFDSASVTRMWVRPIDALEAHSISSLEPASSAIWSPDNASIAFVSGGKLMRVAVDGGSPTPIANAPGRTGGTWSRTGVILLEGLRDSIIAVPETGGAATAATRFDRTRGDIFHGSPRFLPDGKHFLYVAGRSVGGQNSAAIMLARLGSLDAQELGPCDADVEFDPPDRVIYLRGTSLVSRRLDLSRRTLTGDAVSLSEGLPTQTSYTFAAGGGVLVVVNVSGTVSELVWTDRAGRRLGRVGEPGRYREISLSPDERRAAFSIEDPATATEDIWLRDLDRGVSTQLTFGPTQETMPVWSPDGSHIYYSSDRVDVNYAIFRVSALGGAHEDTIRTGSSGFEGPLSVSADGKWLAVSTALPSKLEDWNIVIRDTEGKLPPRPLCSSPALEFTAAISPDGRWIAYSSDETGRSEIYVRSFPDGLRKWRVSGSGGWIAAWTKNGRELVYLALNEDLVAVPVHAGSDFQPGTPVTLFHADLTEFGWVVRRWAVTADGQRFLLNLAIKNTSPGFAVTKNWQTAAGIR